MLWFLTLVICYSEDKSWWLFPPWEHHNRYIHNSCQEGTPVFWYNYCEDCTKYTSAGKHHCNRVRTGVRMKKQFGVWMRLWKLVIISMPCPELCCQELNVAEEIKSKWGSMSACCVHSILLSNNSGLEHPLNKLSLASEDTKAWVD